MLFIYSPYMCTVIYLSSHNIWQLVNAQGGFRLKKTLLTEKRGFLRYSASSFDCTPSPGKQESIHHTCYCSYARPPAPSCLLLTLSRPRRGRRSSSNTPINSTERDKPHIIMETLPNMITGKIKINSRDMLYNKTKQAQKDIMSKLVQIQKLQSSFLFMDSKPTNALTASTGSNA